MKCGNEVVGIDLVRTCVCSRHTVRYSYKGEAANVKKIISPFIM